jgi:hypothetical protein
MDLFTSISNYYADTLAIYPGTHINVPCLIREYSVHAVLNCYERRLLELYERETDNLILSQFEFECHFMDFLVKNTHEVDIFIQKSVQCLYKFALENIHGFCDNDYCYVIDSIHDSDSTSDYLSAFERNILVDFVCENALCVFDIYNDFYGDVKLIPMLRRFLCL